MHRSPTLCLKFLGGADEVAVIRASGGAVAMLADSTESAAHADPSVREGVGSTDDGISVAADLVGDDAGRCVIVRTLHTGRSSKYP